MLSCKVDSKAIGTETHGQRRMSLFSRYSVVSPSPAPLLFRSDQCDHIFFRFPRIPLDKMKLNPQAPHKLQEPLSKRAAELLKMLELPVISGLSELSGSISPNSGWSCGTNWMPSDLIPFRHAHLCLDAMFSEMHIQYACMPWLSRSLACLLLFLSSQRSTVGSLLYTKTRSSLALVKYLQSVEHFTFEIPYCLDL